MVDNFMQMAVELALTAEQNGNLPIAALIVLDGKVIAKGTNAMFKPYFHPGKHAETEALAQVSPELWPQASKMICYTTLEPCLMCYGSLLLHGIGQIVFGAIDIDGGSRYILNNLPPFHQNHSKPKIIGPILPEICDELYKRAEQKFLTLY